MVTKRAQRRSERRPRGVPGSRHQRGTVDRMAYSQPMIEAGSTRVGRWLRARRIRVAIWVAVVEGLIVALDHGVSRWTVMILAIAVLALYFAVGRNMRWDVGRQLAWIAAASQVLALLVVVLAFIVWGIELALVVLFALVALVYLYSDLRRT